MGRLMGVSGGRIRYNYRPGIGTAVGDDGLNSRQFVHREVGFGTFRNVNTNEDL